MMAEPNPKVTQHEASHRALRRVPGLADLGDEALALLGQRMRRHQYGADETIIRCGIRDDFLGVVESGEVRITVELHNGPSFNVLVQAGSYFTLDGIRNLELIHSLTSRDSSSPDSASITVRAVAPTTLLASFRSDWRTLSPELSSGPWVGGNGRSGAEEAQEQISAPQKSGRILSRFINIFLIVIVLVAVWKLWASPWGRDFRADIAYARGLRSLQRGRENAAAWKFWSALHLNPSHAASYNALGYIYDQHGQLEKARAAFERAVRLDDGQGMLYNNWGVAQLQLGQRDGALAHLQRAAALDSEAPEIHVNLGNFYLSEGDAQNAARAYREALRLDPALAMTHYNLGVAYYAQRQLAEAQAAFEQAVALDSDLSPAYLGFGVLAFERGDFVSAQAAFQRATTLDPQEPIAHFYLGLIYKDVNLLEESVLAFERVVGLTEDDIVRKQAEWHLQELWGLP